MYITLIYTDCRAKTSGDYAFAGEVAYALQQFFYSMNIDNQCVLSSSEGGKDCFKRLYGTTSPALLNIHGMPIQVVVLKDFVKSTDVQRVNNYVEVAACERAPVNLVRKIVNPLSTKILHIALPHYDIGAFCFNVNAINARIPPVYSVQYNYEAIGFGPGRIGIPLYKGPFEPLHHDSYANITKRPYGFVYFAGVAGEDAVKFVYDYLKITRYLTVNCQNYVFVGNCDRSFQAAKDYAIALEKKMAIYHLKEKKVYFCEYKKDKNMLDVSASPLSTVTSYAVCDVNIVLLASVPYEQMRALMKNAITLIGTTGVSSEIESVSFGKISLYQFLEHNEIFIQSYQNAVLSNVTEPQKAQNAHRFFQLHTWKKKMGLNEMKEMATLVNDPVFSTDLLKQNEELIKRSTRDVAYMLCMGLNVPKISNTSTLFPSSTNNSRNSAVGDNSTIRGASRGKKHNRSASI